MDLSQIMELGGTGAALQVGTRILGMLSADRGMQKEYTQSYNAENLNAWGQVAKATAGVRGSGGKWVYRMFAIVCVFIIVAPIIVPWISDNVVLHWYVPKAGSWWIWDKAKMIEHVIGPAAPLDGVDLRTHISLLPFMYSFANNVAWFYIAGKPLKHRF